MADRLEGRRLPDVEHGIPDIEDIRNGDYWLSRGHPHKNQGFDGCWMLWWYDAPAAIPLHFVVEHEDGTISVPRPGELGAPANERNSVLISSRGAWPGWHGFIYRGAWEPV